MSADLRAFVPRGSLAWLRDEPQVRHRKVDGSLVFVDISGFTAMSERLAKLGKVGAEEVTDLLNQTFSRLLAVAYEDDGSLLKFGGDALLLQFEGAEHAARAVHAAWGMRRKLRELQPLSSSAGDVHLRMSVGVNTGMIDQFLVGSHHRELIIAGPVATETVQMESAASAGQIMLGRAVTELLQGRIETTASGPGFLLRGTPPTPPAALAPTLKDDDEAHAGGLLSQQVRERLEAGLPQGEHRPVVVGFVKMLGIDEMLATDGPEAVADALGRTVDTVVEAIAPGEVCLLSTDVDAGGAKIILTAGVPTSQEFDGERMLRALASMRAAALPFPLKIGVNHGPVFAGAVGPWFRLTYTIIGDAVNLAARVMGKADPGTVLATREVLNRSQTLFEVEEIPPFLVKGKKQPVRALRIGDVTSQRLRRSRARFRLAGRTEELATLAAELDQARAGPGRVVQLVGPAGLGKSRLVDELHEREPDAHLLMVACSQYESATPYHVARELLRELLALPPGVTATRLERAVLEAAPHQEEALPLLGDIMGAAIPDNDSTRALSPTFRAERAVAAVCALVEAALPGPTILVLEDLHWIDPESWTVVQALTAATLSRRRWLLVLTSRTRLALATHADVAETVLELEPLTDKDARDFVYAAVEEGLVSLERGKQLLERAGGNPFFLQELLRVDDETGDLPADVDALIQSQLDRLPPADRELLGYAAVLGASVDLELLESTTGISSAEAEQSFARLTSFVEPMQAGELRFRHALVHDGAYGRLPFRRRRELHLRAAAALEARGDQQRRPELLALHTYHAREWERARAYALEAANQAQERFANLTAAQHYRHAVESGRHVRGLSDGEVADTWEQLGHALMLSASYEDAVTAFRRAKATAAAQHQVRLCRHIGQVRERQGRYSEALRWFTRGVEIARRIGSDEAGRLLVESAIVKIRQGKPQDAIDRANAAEQAADDLPTAARVSYVRAWAALLMGEDRQEDERRTLALFEQANDLIGLGLAYNVISMSAYYRGDWDAAAEAYEHGATLRRRVGDEVAASVLGANLGELLSDQGHFDRAKPLLEELRTVAAASGFTSGRWFSQMILGRLHARLGDFDTADEMLTEAHERLLGMQMAELANDAQRYRGELAVFRRDVDAALAFADTLEAGAALGTASVRSVGERLRTCAYLIAADADAAAQSARRLLASLDPASKDHDTALSLVVVAEALRGEEQARAAALRAQELLDRLGVVVPGALLAFGPEGAPTAG